MSSGVGIDLLEIDRLERALERHPRLAERVFSRAERDYAGRRARPRATAARLPPRRRWSRRLASAVGFGLGQIEVVAGEPPTVKLSRPAADAAAGRRIEVSLTHSRDFAAAVAIVDTA